MHSFYSKMKKNCGASVKRFTDWSIAPSRWMGPVSVPYASSILSLSLFSSGTGEHGVGVGKTEYLVEELGEDTVELMKTVKNAIDPLNLFNPGKVRDSISNCSDGVDCVAVVPRK